MKMNEFDTMDVLLVVLVVPYELICIAVGR